MKLYPLNCDQASEGYYRAKVTDWGIRQSDGGAVSVSLFLQIQGKYDFGDKDKPAEWSDWSASQDQDGTPYAYTIYCDSYIIKKPEEGQTQGQANPKAIEQLVKAGVWDGQDWSVFEKAPTTDINVVVSAKYEAATDKYAASIRGNWLHSADHVPTVGGIMNKASADKLKSLETMFGPTVKALASVASLK